MKLSSDETRAIGFVLGLVGLAAIARIASRPHAADLPAAMAVDAAALEDSSEQAMEAAGRRGRPLGRDELIDVNTASVAELDRLPGVGAGLAARIVQEREQAGAFASAADLRSVRGIGPGLLAKLEPNLTFGVAPALPRRVTGAHAEGGDDALARTRRDPTSEGPRRGPAARLDLNSATAAELDALPGVGPALAARIVAKRDSLGGFGHFEDLKKVRGIGPTTVERLRPFFRS